MKYRTLSRFLLGCVVSVLLVIPALAQDSSLDEDSTRYYQYYRADDSFYLKGRAALNFYGGDRDINPANEVQKYIENIGFTFGLEVGYHFSYRFSLGLMHLSGRYPRIEDITDAEGRPLEVPPYGALDQSTTSKWRHHFTLVGRSYWFPYERFTPYGQYGINVSFGKINDETRTGIGPMAGIGFDVAASDKIGIFLELLGIFIFDDEALDLADTRAKGSTVEEGNIDASDFDAFTEFGFGLRYNFKSPLVPPLVECVIQAPDPLRRNETVRFAATSNVDATRPVTYQWDFGDGATAAGLFASHSYDRPGTYTARVTATNPAGTDTAVCEPLVVVTPPQVTIAANPSVLSMCAQPLAPVQFTSNVTAGDPPFRYEWDFGDGTTSTEPNPRHTYTRLDADPTVLTYTATLRVTNAAGTATATVDVNIEPCPCQDLAELGQACFARNSSVLRTQEDAQALQSLQDNLEILRDNPSIMVLVEGYASPNERNAQGLADARAQTVRDFYVNGGIDPARIITRGVVQEQAAKTGPVCTLTIPLPCDDEEREQRLREIMGQ